MRILTVMDEYTLESLALIGERRLTSGDVLDVPNDLFVRRGIPEHIGSDNSRELTDELVRDWLETLGVKPLHIGPGSP